MNCSDVAYDLNILNFVRCFIFEGLKIVRRIYDYCYGKSFNSIVSCIFFLQGYKDMKYKFVCTKHGVHVTRFTF